MKKSLSLILACLLLLTACSEKSQESASDDAAAPADTAVTEEAESVPEEPEIDPSTVDDLPELTFEKEFCLLSPTVGHCSSYVFEEELTGDNVTDAKYNMKLDVEKRFGIAVREERFDSWNTSGTLKNLIAAGDSTYDVSFCQDNVALDHLGLCYKLDDLEYLNFDKAYWDHGMVDASRIRGDAYFAYGAYHLSHYDMTHIITFSKGLIDALSLENPYELVRAGEWTIDKLFEMGQKATFDVDGDGSMTDADSYGFVSTPKQVLPCFWISFAERTISADADGTFVLNESEPFLDRILKTFSVMRDGGIWFVNSEGTNFVEELPTMFGSQRVLFADQSFGSLAALRDMDEDFGIIPYPKYTEEQSEYYSRVEGGSLAMFVPMNITDPAEVGAVLEAMACSGYNTLVPEYYEVALKRKSSRDAESMDMLDLISRSRMVDLGDTWWCGTIRDGFFNNCFQTDDRNFASSYAKLSKQVAAQIKQIDKTIEKMGQES